MHSRMAHPSTQVIKIPCDFQARAQRFHLPRHSFLAASIHADWTYTSANAHRRCETRHGSNHRIPLGQEGAVVHLRSDTVACTQGHTFFRFACLPAPPIPK
nr:unnamed protein product [Digitaria exilis]